MRLESGRSAEGRSSQNSSAVVTAYELFRQGKLREAVSCIRDHSDLEDERALFLLAKALTKLQEYSEAKRKLKLALRKTDTQSDPKQYEVRLFLANLYLELGEATRAIREFNKIKEDATAHQIYRATFSGLACANALLGRFNKAFGYLEKARSYPGSDDAVDADLGFILLVEGSHDDALHIFTEVFKKQPDNVRNTYHLANARYLNGQYHQTIEGLNHAIHREPQSIFLRIMLGDTYKALGEYLEAVKQYQTCLDISPNSEKRDYILFQIANCERTQGHQSRAIHVYQQVYKSCARSKYRAIAFSYMKNLRKNLRKNQGEQFKIQAFPRFVPHRERFYPVAISQLLKFWQVTREAIKIPKERIDQGISLPFLRKHSKKFALEQKCFTSNIEQLKRIVSLGFPVLVHEYSGLQGHYINIIGYDDAKGVVIAQDSNFHESQEILYATFLQNWQYHSNKTFLVYPKEKQKLLQEEHFEENPAFDLFDEVSLLLEEARYTEAFRLLSDVRKQYPEDRSTFRLEIELHLQQKNNDEATTLAQSAITLFSEEYWPYRLLGDSYFNKQQYEQALEFYVKAKAKLSQNAELLAKIGETLIYLGKFEKGIASLQKSIELDPRDFWAYGKLGWGYLKKSQFRRAEEQMLYALDSTMDYHDSWGWLHAQLGIIYRHFNQHDKSVSHLKKSLMSNDREPWFEEEFQKSYKLLHHH